jgi:hypothetical protein
VKLIEGGMSFDEHKQQVVEQLSDLMVALEARTGARSTG